MKAKLLPILFLMLWIMPIPTAKTILILAATGELGSVISKFLCEQGYDLILSARSTDKTSKLLADLKKQYPERNIQVMQMDYLAPESTNCEVVANKKLDGIVLIPPRPSFVTTSGIPLESEWNQVFKLTYMGPLDVLKRMIPYVKVGGSVVLISGSSSLQYLPNYPNTNVVRLAWIGELKNLVYYLSPYKIRVNAISPAIILTPFNITKIQKRAAEKGKSFKDELEAVTSHTPLRRYGEPEDVAKVVYFLLSDLASHVNGVNLPVDGGESLTY